MPNPLLSNSPEHWAYLGLSPLQEHSQLLLPMSNIHMGFQKIPSPPCKT